MVITYRSTVPSMSWLLRLARSLSTTPSSLLFGSGAGRCGGGMQVGDDIVELGVRPAEREPADLDHRTPRRAGRRTHPHPAPADEERGHQTDDRDHR